MPDPRRATSGCPGCGKPIADAHKPFCSQGCKDRDLLQWLSDRHRIPGRTVDEDDESETRLDS